MKITKRQLRQIIKEEKQKILRESYDVDDYPYERKVELFDTAVDSIQSIITMERNAFAQGHQGALEGIEYFQSPKEFIFRCQKPDRFRKNFWDTWWFRLTSTGREWTPEKIDTVREHTICIDGRYRLEAYPPENN